MTQHAKVLAPGEQPDLPLRLDLGRGPEKPLSPLVLFWWDRIRRPLRNARVWLTRGLHDDSARPGLRLLWWPR
ncbi:hypothetical protein RCO28_20625 [Streptomyces sp. LHD-70]|uniref:hypothetical protein n=1 Tax=Streptomyces sp. LHD-70 TaxID=3072140 RepID=UPI00280E913E|nr:hypothetical protein [Streptomyces sp. LHD-70]MDQ8704878.1 hypothetical protein [Streptomyces sp. LHD-70]